MFYLCLYWLSSSYICGCFIFQFRIYILKSVCLVSFHSSFPLISHGTILPTHHTPSLPLLVFCLFTSTEIHKNVISPLEGDVKEHVLQQKHTDLKQKMRDLNQGFERLRKLSHEGFTEDSGEFAYFCISISLHKYLINLITGILNHNIWLCCIGVFNS